MLKRFAVAAAGLAIAAAPLLGLASSAPAGATISPTTTYVNDGVAGYYAAPNANRLGNGDTQTGVRSTFKLSSAMENSDIQVGVELCRFENVSLPGAAAVVYAQWDSSSNRFDILAGHSTSSNCLAALGGLNLTDVTTIDTIPVNHMAQLSITVSPHHVITFVDSDQTSLTGGRTTFGGFTFGFDRAGAGTNGDTVGLTAPANNLLTTMTLTSVRDQPGWATFNRSGLTRQVVNKVVDTTTGTAGGQALIAPSAFAANSGNFNLFDGQSSGI
jgi:hypothetical protein